MFLFFFFFSSSVKDIRVKVFGYFIPSTPWAKVSMYDGNLNAEELIDWINTLDKYFNYEEVDDSKKVKFSMMKLREHASIWWDGVQVD